MVGYEKYTLNLTLEENFKLNDIVLKEDISTLKEANIDKNRRFLGRLNKNQDRILSL